MATVELKVGMHCEECIKKIMKAIKKIEDIETYDLDIKQNKITVTGNVTPEEVIRSLHKIGKHASNWEEPRRKIKDVESQESRPNCSTPAFADV